MIRVLFRAVLLLTVWSTILSVATGAQTNLAELKSEYESVTAQLQKHLVHDFWIDDSQESPGLLARQWTLAGELVAAWLNAHPGAGSEGVGKALREIDAANESQYLGLGDETFFVPSPSDVGNVFIVAKMDGQYRLAWSTAQPQDSHGEQAEILAAWRPENAREGGRGPYWAASGSAGSVLPVQMGLLPADAQGHPRFYIHGMYAQGAGGTTGAQVSLWLWDGRTARPLIVRDYTEMIDQAVAARVEGNLLKVQEKKSFRTFFSCGQCEERQTVWIVRLTPEGIEDLGETSMVPELDVIDELFHRHIHDQQAADVAAPAVVKNAQKILREARNEDNDWKEFPSLGMMGKWTVDNNASGKILCLSLDAVGISLFTLKTFGGMLFISDMKPTDKPCEK